MSDDDFTESPLDKALKRQKELQATIKAATETIKAAMQEIEKLKQFTDLYRSLSIEDESKDRQRSDLPSAPPPVSSKFTGHAHGQTQALFEALALDILRDIGRPMKSPEFIEEFRKRGHPLGGNEVRTAWNRLWQTRKAGLLTHDVKLGYWIAGEPLSDEAKQRALEAGKRRLGRGPSMVTLAKGKPKGRPAALTSDQIAEAEKLLLSGKTRKEVCDLFGGISMATLAQYVGRTDEFLAKHPGAVIPKRRPRPGFKPKGRTRILTPEQDQEIAQLRVEGVGIKEIGNKMGIKRTSVYAALKRAGYSDPNYERRHKAQATRRAKEADGD